MTVYVSIDSYGGSGRRLRASQIGVEKRRYQRIHDCTLTLVSKGYSEAHGFLSKSTFRYEVSQP